MLTLYIAYIVLSTIVAVLYYKGRGPKVSTKINITQYAWGDCANLFMAQIPDTKLLNGARVFGYNSRQPQRGSIARFKTALLLVVLMVFLVAPWFTIYLAWLDAWSKRYLTMIITAVKAEHPNAEYLIIHDASVKEDWINHELVHVDQMMDGRWERLSLYELEKEAYASAQGYTGFVLWLYASSSAVAA